jgi:hypothetical protein
MGLAQLATEGPRPVIKGERCSVARAKDRMSADQVRLLTDALGDPAFSTAQIAAAMLDDGFDVRAYTLGRHRQGRCRCGTL